MAATAIADLVTPDFWSAYAISDFPQHATLFESGIIRISPEIIGPGTLTQGPFAKSLNTVGAEQQLADTVSVAVRSTSAFQQTGYIVRRGNAIGISDIAGYASGLDFARVYLPQVSKRIAREHEITAINTINAWDAEFIANLTGYVTSNGTASVTLDMLVSCIASLNDAESLADVWVMSTRQKAKLTKLGLVNQMPATAFADGIIQKGLVDTILGRRIVVNNLLCVVYSSTIEDIFLMEAGMVKMSFQAPQRVVGYRDEALSGGTDVIQWTAGLQFAMGGVSWTEPTNDVNPTNAQILAGAWTIVAETPNDIRIRKVKVLSA